MQAKPNVPYWFRIIWFWVVAFLIVAANLQLLAVYPLAFIAPAIFDGFARNIAQLLWPGLVWSFENLNHNNVTFYGDLPPESEAAVVLANHQYHCDWLIVFNLALRRRMIRGVRVVVKGVVMYAPFIGTVLNSLGFIFLSRSWQSDETMLKKAFQSIHRSPEPFWLISHPEGTRLTPQKLKESNDFAKAKGFVQTKYVMQPRTKGFAASIATLRDKATAVYDLTIAYRSKPGGWVGNFTGLLDKPTDVHVYIRRFEIKNIPTNEAELDKWLYKLYEAKDKLLTTYNEKQKFDGPTILENTNQAVSTGSVFSGIGRWLLSFLPFGAAYGLGLAWYLGWL